MPTLSITETASLIGISEDLVLGLLESGKIIGKRERDQILLDRGSVDRYLYTEKRRTRRDRLFNDIIKQESDLKVDSSLSVLFVDDVKLNRKLCEVNLATFGIKPKVASSAEEALEFIAKQMFDLIITDFHMPGMSGKELTEVLRKQEERTDRHTLIVVCTASLLVHIEDTFALEGFDSYLPKPFTRADVERVLKVASVLKKYN